MTTEMPHVYQNRTDTYPIRAMHFCPVCNGYYGVPHQECVSKGGCKNRMGNCACRYHRELAGKSRQGECGWVTK